LARAAQATGEKRYLDAAQRAATFVVERVVKDGRLHRRYRGGEVAIPAFLEDHAFVVEGLLDLYEADFDPRWLREARELMRRAIELFEDRERGGFFSTPPSHDSRISRRKELYDGAVPSGNAVAYANLLRLHRITGDDVLGAAIERFESLAGSLLRDDPTSHPQLLAAVELRLARPVEIVVLGAREDADTGALIDAIRKRFHPAKVVLFAESAESAKELTTLSPLFEAKIAIDGKATAYVCRDRVCKLPARDVDTLRKQLDEAQSEAGKNADADDAGE